MNANTNHFYSLTDKKSFKTLEFTTHIKDLQTLQYKGIMKVLKALKVPHFMTVSPISRIIKSFIQIESCHLNCQYQIVFIFRCDVVLYSSHEQIILFVEKSYIAWNRIVHRTRHF